MVISTYQAASGAGQAAMDELELQTKEVLEGKEVTKNIFPFQVSVLRRDYSADLPILAWGEGVGQGASC